MIVVARSTDSVLAAAAKAREGAWLLGVLLLAFPAAGALIAAMSPQGTASQAFAMTVAWGIIYGLLWVAIVVRAVRLARHLTSIGWDASARRAWREARHG